MKVSLNQQELGAIVVAWAKKQYKTHNVSADFEVDVHPPGSIAKSIEAILEITLSDDQITDASSKLSEDHLRGLHAKLKGIENRPEPIEEAGYTMLDLFSPDVSSSVLA